MLIVVSAAAALVPLLPHRSNLAPSFRVHSIKCVAAGAYSSDEWSPSRARDEEETEDDGDSSTRWLRIAGCDVLPPPPGAACSGVVHFVGGALVGSAPQQAYGTFLEGISDDAKVCIVATPCTGLDTGLDHWQAASEVMLRWCAARSDVDKMLQARSLPALDALPVIGCGHSLGAKLLLLLGSDAGMADALGPRCANALVCFNNYSARQSVPMLDQAVQLGQDSGPLGELARFSAQAGGGQAAAAARVGATLGSVSSAGLKSAARAVGTGDLADTINAGMGALGLGGLGKGATSDALADGLESLAGGLGDFGRTVGAAGETIGERAAGVGSSSADTLKLDDEFTPGPAETDRVVSGRYAVGRNLLVRFSEDTIDQSSGLARLLKARFTDDVTGIGGRLDFKSLGGTHVTPNAPRLPSEAEIDRLLASVGGGGALADAVAGIRDVAFKASREREVASEVVADFVRRETRKAADEAR